MKVTAAVAIVLLLAPVTVFAQSIPMIPGSLELTATGGASVPFGDFNLIAEPGFGVGAQAGYYVMPNLAIGGSIVYNSYGLDDAFSAFGLSDMSIWEFSAFGKYLFLPGPVAPYGKGMVGLFRSKIENSSTANDIGGGLGLGAQIKLPASNVGFFGEGMANFISTEGSTMSYYSIRAGINLYVSTKP